MRSLTGYPAERMVTGGRSKQASVCLCLWAACVSRFKMVMLEESSTGTAWEDTSGPKLPSCG